MRTGLIELTISTPGCARTVDGDHFRAVHAGLRELAEGDFSVGEDDSATQSGAAGIGGGRGGGVAGAGADDELGAVGDGLCHRCGHAAILEGRGRIHRLVLKIKLEPAAGLGRKARSGNERRIALQQRDDFRVGGQPVEVGPVMLKDAGPAGKGRGMHHAKIGVRARG
jgi:hypothetical protein